ncbi:Apocarotenoid-15,15'-oxygenase [Streptomyces sp. YIM 130001]|uniref:carotenoid oxygenase family protein n=1 Tax=Streptomyces sp. YIM 130001 TaxID=2259644 RepID=UPI000E64E62F|nr:carotenoid oxygenase family protein [Streptomyces sp. YIM 130001]RII07911.1 Apocarotenoid-15,15'-oxygenase [Streptomyces sp. YIM 130001]
MRTPGNAEPPAAPDFAAGLRSLDAETAELELPVTGALPDWLAGSLLRNGPARFEAGARTFRHWFDGQAMLHRFSLSPGGRVGYVNRYVDTPSSRAARDEGRIAYMEFATDPCRSLFSRFFTLFSTPAIRRAAGTASNPNVNIARFGERFVALTETPVPVEFDPQTLTTAGVVDYGDGLRGQITSAHPHRDPATGDLINYLTHFSRRSEYRVYRQPAGRTERELIGSHRAAAPAYMHSFGITGRHLVLTEFSLVVNPLRLLLSGRPFIDNFRWQPERGTRFIVFDLQAGGVRGVFEGPTFFAFHHINAWEEGEDIVLDLAAYPDSAVVDAFRLDRLRGGGDVPQAHPTRCRISLPTGEVTAKRLSDEPMELPSIAYASHNGRPYRYAYGIGARGGRTDDFANQLVKLDTASRSTHLWHTPGHYPGEPVFVPAPEAVAEDDGVVLSIVLDATQPREPSSFLLVLDARDFTELARARAPHAIPFGFHGLFTH